MGKAARPPAGARRSRKRKRSGRGWKLPARPGVALWAALLLIAGLALVLRPRHLPPPPLEPPRLVPRSTGAPADLAAVPPAGPEGAAPAQRRPGIAERPATPAAPRVAVVIDDLGDSLAQARAVLALEPAVTVAVIPFRPASALVAAAAVEQGREVILHLPLEPEQRDEMEGADGFLRARMPPDLLEQRLERNLRAVPYIVGVNSHMGSRFTRDPGAMHALLAALHARGLFFVDSRTSPESVAHEIAARLGVPFAERTLFLDHDPSPAAVERAIAETAALARRGRDVIAIGHPHQSTLAGLAAWLPTAARQGIAVVPLSALVR